MRVQKSERQQGGQRLAERAGAATGRRQHRRRAQGRPETARPIPEQERGSRVTAERGQPGRPRHQHMKPGHADADEQRIGQRAHHHYPENVFPLQPLFEDEGVLRADGDDERQTEGETGEVGVHRKIRGRAQDEGAHFACKRRRRLVIGCAVLRPVAAFSEGNAEPPLRALRRLRFGFQSPAGRHSGEIDQHNSLDRRGIDGEKAGSANRRWPVCWPSMTSTTNCLLTCSSPPRAGRIWPSLRSGPRAQSAGGVGDASCAGGIAPRCRTSPQPPSYGAGRHLRSALLMLARLVVQVCGVSSRNTGSMSAGICASSASVSRA